MGFLLIIDIDQIDQIWSQARRSFSSRIKEFQRQEDARKVLNGMIRIHLT